MQKLFRMYKLNAPRCAVAAHIHTLAEIEITGRRPIKSRDLVDLRRTKIVGMAVDADDHEEFVEAVRDTSNRFVNTGHNTFWMLLKLSMSKHPVMLPKNKFMNSIDEDRDFCTDERAWSYFLDVAKLVDKQIADDFPQFDSLHSGRSHLLAFAKCLLYIRLKLEQIELRESDLNDFDDCQYACYASLTGSLATCDKGLKRMVNVCFPWTEIID